MISPKEKAKQLVDKYFHACNCTIAGTHTIFKALAKDLAILCIDEILISEQEAYTIPIITGAHFDEYWNQVKKEIKNI